MKKTIFLFYLASFALLFLGPNVLYSLGYYNFSFLSKFNLSFLLFFAAFLLQIDGTIFKERIELCLFVYMVALSVMTYLLVGETYMHESLTAVIFPPLFLILLKKVDRCINWKNLSNMVYIFFIINSTMAIVEYVRGAIFFPTLPGEKELFFWGYFRSMALKGHPLANSGITCLIMMFVMLYCKSNVKKSLLILLGFLAILCFNSRFTLVVSSLMFALFVVYEVFVRKVRFRWKFFYLITVVGLICLTVYLFSMGWGSRLVEYGLVGDDSSMVRVEILNIFNYGWTNFLIGVPPNDVKCILTSIGFRGIIENCWILLMLRYGIPFLLIAIVLYTVLFRKVLLGMNRWEASFVVIPWLAYTSSSNSIATGGMGICTLMLLIFIFKKQTSIFVKRGSNDS